MKRRCGPVIPIVLLVLNAGPCGRPAGATTPVDSTGQSRSNLPTDPFLAGEILQYKVCWKFVRLGTLTVTQAPAGPGAPGWFLVGMHGATAKGLPFLDFEFRNRSLLRASSPDNRLFFYETRKEGHAVRMQYRSNPVSKEVRVSIERSDSVPRLGRIPLDKPAYDAGGLIMLIRCLSRVEIARDQPAAPAGEPPGDGLPASPPEAAEQAVPTIVDQAIHPTLLQFTGETREVRIEAFPRPALARRCKARAEWTAESGAGMTGDFDVWLSDDPSAIPLRASIQIALGSIEVELERCLRPQQEDPAAPEEAGCTARAAP